MTHLGMCVPFKIWRTVIPPCVLFASVVKRVCWLVFICYNRHGRTPPGGCKFRSLGEFSGRVVSTNCMDGLYIVEHGYRVMKGTEYFVSL